MGNTETLSAALQADMPRLTLARVQAQAMANARANAPWGQSIAQLPALGEGDKAVIIAAGPSLRRRDPAAALDGFTGAILATDSALRYCLSAGLVPDLVVTLDPHPTRIARWFGSPIDPEDDYFRRQDIDPQPDEHRANLELLSLLAEHGKGMNLAIASTSHPSVAARAREIGMQLYWWNPMLDDPDTAGYTQELIALNGLPCVNAGGNVGSACWMFADAVFRKKKVALTGMDFSYYDGTPYAATQYYREALEIFGEDAMPTVFQNIFNPFVGKWFYTDPAYLWYRNCFLEMAGLADCQTWNCTGGGILFGEGIRFATLQEFLDD